MIWTYKPGVTGKPFVYPGEAAGQWRCDDVRWRRPRIRRASTGTDVLREIDLAGDTVRELSMATLNAEMVTAGFPITLDYFTHDFVPLPNGHVLVMAIRRRALRI